MVTAEEGSVDFDAGDGAGGDTQADDGVVEGLGVVAAGLPAVVPRAGEDELGFVLDGWLGVYQVGGVGEPFVGAGEDGAA